MAERAGYDQPGDGYTCKHAVFGINALPPYEPEIPKPQRDDTQQSYAMQQPDHINTNTIVVVDQPSTNTLNRRQRPPDYICASVLACLFCFWPTGICAIHYATEATILADAGDYEGAKRMSEMAKGLMISSVIVGITVTVNAIVIVWLMARENVY